MQAGRCPKSRPRSGRTVRVRTAVDGGMETHQRAVARVLQDRDFSGRSSCAPHLRGMISCRHLGLIWSLLPLLVMSQSDTVSVYLHHSGCDTDVRLEKLRSLTLRSATIRSHDGVKATYEGAWIKDVLALNCPSIAAIEKRTMVNSYVRVGSADGYTALIALTECDSSFRERPVILAWKKNGQPLDGHDGPIQLIVPDDLRHARDVRQVRRLEMVTP